MYPRCDGLRSRLGPIADVERVRRIEREQVEWTVVRGRTKQFLRMHGGIVRARQIIRRKQAA
jgi:hypothetical protein